jgi:uncharacterized membrane protein YkoI
MVLLGVVLSFGQKSQKPTQADLQKEAKITKEQAAKTALAKVPNGTIKESELEQEKGKLVWSFDIAAPGAKEISEVQVDAKTGDVVSVENESAESEAAEKKAERPKDKPEKKN